MPKLTRKRALKPYCATCNNTGSIDCYCGGDLCVCGAEEIERPDCHDDNYDDDMADFTCPTCHGKGTVNPLTAPKDFFCVSTTDCPTCDGRGEF